MPLSIKDREVLEENLTLEATEILVRTAELSAVEFLTTILRDEFKDEICAVSSFGAEAAVLLHMVAQIDPTTPVIFLNTGKIFGETLRYRDRLQTLLGLLRGRALGRDRLAPVRLRCWRWCLRLARHGKRQAAAWQSVRTAAAALTA